MDTFLELIANDNENIDANAILNSLSVGGDVVVVTILRSEPLTQRPK